MPKVVSRLFGTVMLMLFCPDALWADINEDLLTLCAQPSSEMEKELSQAVANGANVNYRAPNGETPLMILVRFLSTEERENEYVVDTLLKAEVEIDARDKAGNTALMHAVKNNAPASLLWRLLDYKPDVNAKNDAGVTPLSVAASEVSNPAVTAVLLLAGAETTGVTEEATKNPNWEEVTRLVEYFLAHKGQGQPLFADLPADEGLRNEIQTLDAKIRSNFNKNKEYNFGSYVEWQCRLPSDINAYIRLGRNPRDAWLAAYNKHLKDITVNEHGTSGTILKLAASPQARMIVSGNYGSRGALEDAANITTPDYIPKFLVADRSIMIVEWPSGLAGYEVTTGRELWRNPSQSYDKFLLNGVIFGFSVLNDSIDVEATAVGAINGRTLWQMRGSCSTWATDHRKKKLFLDMYSCGALFDFDMFGKSDDWIQTYDSPRDKNGWVQANETYQAIRQKKLVAHGLRLNSYPQFIEDEPVRSDASLLLPNEFMGLLSQSYCSDGPVFQHGSNKTVSPNDALAVDDSGFFRFSVWGPNRNLSNPDQTLLLFDRIEDSVSELKLNDGRVLTGHDLRVTQDEIGNSEFSLAFSPEGTCLGIMDLAGDLHFFDTKAKGRYTGSIKGNTKIVINSKPVTLGALQFISILDEDITGQPVCHFRSPDNPLQPVVLKLNLAQNQAALFFSPEQVATSKPTALDLSSKNIIAAGLDNGELRLIDLNDGRPQLVKLKNTSPWSRLVFSGNGDVLVAVNEAGGVYSIKSQTVTKIADGLKDIIHLVVDAEGRRVWATNESNDGTYSITFIDAEKTTKPIRVPLEGTLITMAFDPKHKQAKAIIGQAEGLRCLNEPVQFSPTFDQKTQTQLLVMSDCLIPPGARSFGDIWGGPINRAGLGYAPNHKILVTEPNCECGVGITQHFYIGLETGKRGAFEVKDLIPSFMGATFFSPDSQLVVLAEYRGRFFLYNTQTGNMLASMADISKHPLGISSGAFLKDGSSRFFTAGPDGSLRLWDLKGGNPVNILTWVFFQDGNWLVLDTDSRFDTPELDHLDGVHWVVKSLPGKPMPLASLMRVYYQPRLAEYTLNEKKLPTLPQIDQLNLSQHGVRLVKVEPEPEAPDKVAVTVEVYLRGDDPHHPAQELKLFRDGQLVGKYTGENGGLFDLPDGKRQVTFRNIALPRNKNQVMFKAWAFNEDGVRSKYFDRPYEYQSSGQTAPKLHLVSIGVNNFDNQAWDLKYAANDANGFARAIPARLPGVGGDIRLMTSNGGNKPTKATIKEALRQLADGGSSPDDVVLLTVSSHGLTDDKDNKFYIIPADIPGKEKKVTSEILAHSISADELGDWLTGLDAAEIIMILDTCQSGAALGGETFKPGPMGDKGLGQMAYDKAMRVLSATNENNAAMEIGDLGHGLLSYALLVDGLEHGLAGAKDGFTLTEWLAYGKERTAELYAKIAKGESIGETRGKVKIDKTSGNANPPLGQEPYLFDFGGADKNTIRFQAQ